MEFEIAMVFVIRDKSTKVIIRTFDDRNELNEYLKKTKDYGKETNAVNDGTKKHS